MLTQLKEGVPSPSRLQRSHGACELTIAGEGDGSSRLIHLYQEAPCRILFPAAEPGGIFNAVLVNTSGGLAGGDTLKVDVRCTDQAHALVMMQAAEKVYRSLGNPTQVDVSIHADARTWLEWLPQETILFDGAGLRRRNRIAADSSARLLVAEFVALGRQARGETFTTGFLHDAWEVRIDGRLLWADTLRLDRDLSAVLRHKAGFAGQPVFATVLLIAPDAARYLDRARNLLHETSGYAAVTSLGSLLIARFLSANTLELRRTIAHYWSALRQAVAGLAPVMPRLWHI